MIALTGKLDRILKSDTSTIVSFDIPNYMARYIDMEKDKDYKIAITEVKSKRSLQQNAMLWELISQIAKASDLIPDEDRVYMELIKLAKIKTVHIQTIPEARNDLLKAFRYIIEKERRTSDKGVETVVYECFYGSSTFSTEEMTRFIDVTLYYAEQVGINTKEYR